MATVDFYSNLHYDFSDYENDDELIGLTTAGFSGSDHLKINEQVQQGKITYSLNLFGIKKCKFLGLIKYNKDGSIGYEGYWVNGRLLSKEEWEKEYGWKLQLKGTPMEKIYCK